MLGNTRIYRTVKSSVQAYKDNKPYDLRLMQEEQQQKIAMESAAEYNKECLKQVEEKEKERAAFEAMNHLPNLNRMKAIAYTATERDISDIVVTEAFSRIYIDALPHDKDFILENYNGLKNMAKFYIRKLGGAQYIRQRVMEHREPFLTKFYETCMEAAKKIKDKRKKKIAAALSESEVEEMIVPQVNDEEREVIINHINTLGTDELSELVKDKIINVVKDEHQREKEEREFRTVLKNDIQDPGLSFTAKEGDVKKKGGSIDTEDDDMLSDVEPTESDKAPDTKKPEKKAGAKSAETTPKEAEKEEDTDKKEDPNDLASGVKPLVGSKEDKDKKKDDKKAAKESAIIDMDLETALERWNPMTRDFTYKKKNYDSSLFVAICHSVMTDLFKQKVAFENADAQIVKEPVSETLIKNPLNLDIFNEYVKSNERAIDVVTKSDFNEPQIYASTDPGVIDKDRILTESLIQYGLLETAYTMKLIEPSEKEVREQINYLIGRK